MNDTPALKPGYKTSEFWTALLTMILGSIPGSAAMLTGNHVVGGVIAAISMAAPIAYIVSRAVLKAKAAGAQIPPAVVDAAGEVASVSEIVQEVIKQLPKAAQP